MEQAEALSNVVHLLLEERALTQDPHWESFCLIASVTPDVSDMTAFRYHHEEPGKPTPLRSMNFDPLRRLQQTTLTPQGTPWEIAIIKIDRNSRRFAATFMYGAEADLWRVTPATVLRVAENARPRPADFD